MKKRPYDGTCLVKGKHKDPKSWAECPVNPSSKGKTRVHPAARPKMAPRSPQGHV